MQISGPLSEIILHGQLKCIDTDIAMIVLAGTWVVLAGGTKIDIQNIIER